MNDFLEISHMSLTHMGEELCGDRVKTLRTEDKTIIVLSDGLGSGVKANILATLTTEIIVTMWKNEISLEEILKTVIGTLPVCKERGIAYATFTIIEINHADTSYRVFNLDNPPTFFFRDGVLQEPKRGVVELFGRKILTSSGKLKRDDFLGFASDGVLYAGLGVKLNFGWGRDNVGHFIEDLFANGMPTAQGVVNAVMRETQELYGNEVGDDATFVGLLVRERHSVMVFTGPPLDPDTDDTYAERLVSFKGRKVACGGSTASLVARFKHDKVKTVVDSLRRDVPPIGKLRGIDLVTEGLITMIRCSEYLRECKGQYAKLPEDDNGAVLLAKELMRADSIHFVVGQCINEFYQNPTLPSNISLRKNLVTEISDLLTSYHKEVRVEFC